MLDSKMKVAGNAFYTAPECSIVSGNYDSVLCQSGNTEDYNIIDPWGNN